MKTTIGKNENDAKLRRNQKQESEPLPLHWLTGGVWTSQALGSAKARVWFTVTPIEEPPPLSNEQRQRGCDWTMLLSCEQHEGDGVDELPLTYLRHGDKLTSAVMQPDWAAVPFHSTRTENRTRTISTPLTAISTGLLFLDLFGQTENANLGEERTVWNGNKGAGA